MQDAKCKIENLKFATTQQRGFSLVELLVAMAIASVLGMAGVALFSTSNWTYKVNEDVSEAQQNVRVAMEWLSKDIRTAGFGLEDPPTSLTFTGLASTFVGQSGGSITLSSPITVSNNSTGPDTITILGIGYEAGTLVGASSNENKNSKGYLCYLPPSPVSDNEKFFKEDGTSNAAPYSNRKYINLNGTTFIQLLASQIKANCDTYTSGIKLQLSSPSTLDKDYPDGTPVYIIQAVQYTINNATPFLTGCSAANPCLASYDATELRGSGRQVLAENIEDLQFAYGIDVSPRDGRIDDYNADSSFTTADFVNDPADDTSIIAVRANVVAKTRNIDVKGGQFTRPAVEDRAAATSKDGYRRRLLTKIIKLRNPRSGGS